MIRAGTKSRSFLSSLSVSRMTFLSSLPVRKRDQTLASSFCSGLEVSVNWLRSFRDILGVRPCDWGTEDIIRVFLVSLQLLHAQSRLQVVPSPARWQRKS